MFVLDTCAISEAMSVQRNRNFTNWFASQKPDRLATTTITVTEIAHGLMRLPEGKRREELLRAVKTLFRSLHIYEQDKTSAWLAGEMIALEERAGRTLKFADAAIAAITLNNDGQLVTRDADFEGVNRHDSFRRFQIINPWSEN
ncbi:MAG: PIN domain-containing protein [Geminicoccaceae bacterium]|nr:PIN domain-containing protein [Anaerolineae bacterium]MCB1970328.1 PIN domain-containing protein [Geminicoccaceae bacterium]